VNNPMTMPDPLIDRRGVNAVENIFLNDFRWGFREQTVIDFGIDAQAEVFENGKPTGKLIALQIKTGSSYSRTHGTDYIYYGEKRHLEYWLGHSLPVFLILHDSERDLTLWQKIDQGLARVAEKGWSIIIPATNVLSGAARPAFEAVAARIPADPSSIRRARMAMDLDLMRLLAAKEDDIYFEIEHWVNKSLGMRGIAVMFGETEKDQPDLELEWMYPVTSYEWLMIRWFPWLDYEHVETRETATVEIDIVVLRVWVNDLGKGYIAAESYFEDGLPDPELPLWHGIAAGMTKSDWDDLLS
jgi:hypothetical protein